LKQELIEKGFFGKDKFIDESKSLSFLIKNNSYEILSRCDATDTATNLWNWLKFEFNNANPYALKSELRRIKMNGIDLESFYYLFSTKVTELKRCSKITDGEVMEIFLENLNQEFFWEIIRSLRLEFLAKEVAKDDLQKAKTRLQNFIDATPSSFKVKFQANLSSGKKLFCSLCKKHSRFKCMRSHVDNECKFGDINGYTESNKDSSSYSFQASFHDTGCTPISFFKSAPSNITPYNGSVKTANKQAAKIVGIGNVKIGNLQLKAAHVPSFHRNLVSGIQLMKEGYKQIIYQDKLQVFKDDILVATGIYNSEVGLIQMDDNAPECYYSRC
jgi:hypothetical protein